MRNLFLILSLFSSQLLASVCENINLYEKAQFDRTIYNQGDMHTCYAHSLSALYSHEYKQSINPYWIAYIHKDKLLHWNPRNLNFSLLSWAFTDLKKRGNCSPTQLESRLEYLKQGTNYSDDQFFYFVQIYFKKEQEVQKLFNYLKETSKDFEVSWLISDVQKLVKTIENSGHKKLFDFFEKEVFSDCSQLSPVTGKLINTARGFESNEELQKEIMTQLTQQKAISIGLCPNAAYKLSNEDIKIKPRILKATKSGCGAHYVNIVGSRESNNRCEFLIRNSYPGFWAHESLTCLCERDGTTFNCQKDTKDKVLGCWVPSDKVLTNTYDISYFE